MMIVSRQPVPPNERGPAKRRRIRAGTGAASCALPRLRLLLARRKPIRIIRISCPACHSSSIRRSKRRSVQDFLFSAAGVLPWRCETCHTRFRARLMPLRTLFYAHCANCGNLELQRISAERVPGARAAFGRILRLPALRCDPCRHKFFSVRPLRQQADPVAAAPGE